MTSSQKYNRCRRKLGSAYISPRTVEGGMIVVFQLPSALENRYVIVDLGTMALRHTLGDPNDITAFLLLEFHERVEDAELKLAQEGSDVQLHFVLEELVFQRFLSGFSAAASACIVEKCLVLGILFRHEAHLIVVSGARQTFEADREQLAATRKQLRSIVLGQFGSERIDGNHEGTSIRFESEQLAHDFGRRAAQLFAKVIKRLQVRLVERVTNNLVLVAFDVDLIQILLADAVLEERSERRVDKHSIVEFCT